MSFPSTSETKKKSKKATSGESIVSSTDKIERSDSGRSKSITMKKQNFFVDEQETNYLQATLNIKIEPRGDKSQEKPGTIITTPNLTTRIITQTAKEDANVQSDDQGIHDEENLDLSPLPESKLFSTAEKFSPAIPVLKRQDSTPVLVKDFKQIEKNLDDAEASSPLFGPDKSTFLSNSGIGPSKFALDSMKKSSNTGFLFGNKRKIHDFARVAPFSEDGKSETPGSDEREGKKIWNKLGNAFQSVVMIQREEVRSITDSAAISHEINSFQLRKINEKPGKVWDISRQDFAREAFQKIRRVQIFCECAAIGSPKHLEMMQELFQKDPKRFMLEPDNPDFILNHVDNHGHTPLYIAAKNGNTNIVQFLIESKANPLIGSRVNYQGKTLELPIVVACRWGHSAVVEYLLKNGQYTDKVLQECIAVAQSQSVKILLRKSSKKMHSDGWRGLVKCFIG